MKTYKKRIYNADHTKHKDVVFADHRKEYSRMVLADKIVDNLIPIAMIAVFVVACVLLSRYNARVI